MTRGGRTKERDTPERRCIATGQTEPKAGLIRFVVGPGDEVVPDLLGRLPGRGIWVSAKRTAVDKAVGKNLFSRAAKKPVKARADMSDLISGLLVDRVAHTIGLARKAGEAVAGFEKVKTWLEKEEADVLLQASDGSAGMKSKLRPPHGPESYVNCLNAQELGMAFGRETVIHAALSAGGLATLCLSDAVRLKGMRSPVDAGKASVPRETRKNLA